MDTNINQDYTVPTADAPQKSPRKRVKHQSDKDASIRWLKKTMAQFSVHLYKEDHAEFKAWCDERGITANAFFRACVSKALGRPLENRAKDPMAVEKSKAVRDAAYAAVESIKD